MGQKLFVCKEEEQGKEEQVKEKPKQKDPQPVPKAKGKAVNLHEDFKLIKKIGSGGYGEVFLIKMNHDGKIKIEISKLYAQKKISKKKVQQQKDSIINEKEIMRKVKSPFIQSLTASKQDDNYIYFFTPFEIGGDLMTYLIKKKTLKEFEARFYAAEILLGLEALHKHKIIHRDIKLENILISKTGHVKITDFGISIISDKDPNVDYKQNYQKSILQATEEDGQILSRISDIKQFQGTLQYNAPEILKNQEINYQADFWAYGILLFMLMKGYHPFDDTGAQNPDLATFYNIIEGNILEYQGCPQLSHEADQLISLLLDVNQYSRLGAGGIQQIKNHGFFKSVDWKKCEAHKTEPPFIPSDKDLFQNFDDVQSIDQTNFAQQAQTKAQTYYKDFTYYEQQQDIEEDNTE